MMEYRKENKSIILKFESPEAGTLQIRDIDLYGREDTCLVYRGNDEIKDVIVLEFFPKNSENDCIYIDRDENGCIIIPECVEEAWEFQEEKTVFFNSYILSSSVSDVSVCEVLFHPLGIFSKNRTFYIVYPVSGFQPFEQVFSDMDPETFMICLKKIFDISNIMSESDYLISGISPKWIFVAENEDIKILPFNMKRKDDTGNVLRRKRNREGELPKVAGTLLLRYFTGREENLAYSDFCDLMKYERKILLPDNIMKEIYRLSCLLTYEKRYDIMSVQDEINLILDHIDLSRIKDYPMKISYFTDIGKNKKCCQDVFSRYDLPNGTMVCLADGVSSGTLSEKGALIVQSEMAKFAGEMDIRNISEEEFHYRAACTIRESIWHAAKYYECEKKELASTFLAVLIPRHENFYWIFHLGDGVIGEIREDDQVHIVSYPQNGITKEYTYTTVTGDLYFRLRVSKKLLTPYLFAMTDGISEEIIENGKLKEPYWKYFKNKDLEGMKKMIIERKSEDDAGIFLIDIRDCFGAA